MNIRKLRAEEIDIRVQHIRAGGCSLVLYIDARVAMKILDESFGITGWQREHEMIGENLYCSISIWDEKKGQWISKEDVGVQSMADGEKGQASDAFKRACINLGIARELYTAPFIWINLENHEILQQGNRARLKPGLSFKVKDIGYDFQGNINKLIIVDNKGKLRWSFNKKENEFIRETSEYNLEIEKEKPITKTFENKKSDLNCESCGVEITPGISNFSKQNFNKSLCINCQKEIEEKN